MEEGGIHVQQVQKVVEARSDLGVMYLYCKVVNECTVTPPRLRLLLLPDRARMMMENEDIGQIYSFWTDCIARSALCLYLIVLLILASTLYPLYFSP